MRTAKYAKMNLYGIDSHNGQFPDELQNAVIHFAKKHGVIPDLVLINPKRMPGFTEFEVKSNDTGETHIVRLVADPEQLMGCFMVAKEGG